MEFLKLKSSLEACFLIKSSNQVFMECIYSHKLFNWKVITEKKHRVPDAYYVNNDYTDVTKVHENYVGFRTDRKYKKCRKTNSFSKRIGRKYRLV